MTKLTPSQPIITIMPIPVQNPYPLHALPSPAAHFPPPSSKGEYKGVPGERIQPYPLHRVPSPAQRERGHGEGTGAAKGRHPSKPIMPIPVQNARPSISACHAERRRSISAGVHPCDAPPLPFGHFPRKRGKP